MARNVPGSVVSVSRGSVLSDVNFQDRVVHPQGTGQEVLKEGFLVGPDDVDTITATLWNMTSQQQVGPVTVDASNFSDTLVNDDQWTQDLIGRNFLVNVPGSLFSVPAQYRLILDLTLTNGGRRKWAHERTVEKLEP